MSEAPYTKIIREGTWLYDRTIERPVFLLERNFDPYFEENVEDDTVYLNADGKAYYVVFGPYEPMACNSSLRSAGLTLEKALERVSELTNGTVVWAV